jgi:hypothetical protein
MHNHSVGAELFAKAALFAKDRSSDARRIDASAA